jgi:antitoxin MazE
MTTRIVSIGNSRGIRIPKLLLEQTGIDGEVVVTAEKNTLVIRSLHRPRSDWEAAFQQMHSSGDDVLLDRDSNTTWDKEEWQW